MAGLCISQDSTAKELEPLAMAIYGVVGLPTTIRSKNQKGVRIENGKVVDYDYTGPYLEEALRTGNIFHGFAASGPYKGMPVIVSPINDSNGETIAVLGTVNLSGYIDLKRF
ncbi:MAG: DUF2111 domain-containing protein [ANME-2 cluster archaeon]|jgi:hypothetical protein|nr:DUF2111 domain-containing protein [ANME-2 cluster archaeon]